MTGFSRILEDLNDAKVRYVLIGGTVAMKRAVARERDLVDLADLEAAHGELP
jgi:predicted nucleotidyltransferase